MVRPQDPERPAFTQDDEGKPSPTCDQQPAADSPEFKELVTRLQLAESQLATMTAAPPLDPVASEELKAASFVLDCEVADATVYHSDFEVGEDDDCDTAAAGLKYVEASMVAARAVQRYAGQLRQLAAANAELTRRNALLRSRHDLPADRTPAGQKYEAQIRELTAKSLSCVFCGTPATTLRELKEHSARCQFHPLYIAAHGQAAESLPVPAVSFSAEEMGNFACAHLPEGYVLLLIMEKGQAHTEMRDAREQHIAVMCHNDEEFLHAGEMVAQAVNIAREREHLPPVEAPVSPPRPSQADSPVGAPAGSLLESLLTPPGQLTLRIGDAGLLVGNACIVDKPYGTVISLKGIVGPDAVLAPVFEQLRAGKCDLQFYGADGRPLPLLRGCRLNQIGQNAASAGMVIVTHLNFTTETPIIGTAWMQYATRGALFD